MKIERPISAPTNTAPVLPPGITDLSWPELFIGMRIMRYCNRFRDYIPCAVTGGMQRCDAVQVARISTVATATYQRPSE